MTAIHVGKQTTPVFWCALTRAKMHLSALRVYPTFPTGMPRRRSPTFCLPETRMPWNTLAVSGPKPHMSLIIKRCLALKCFGLAVYLGIPYTAQAAHIIYFVYYSSAPCYRPPCVRQNTTRSRLCTSVLQLQPRCTQATGPPQRHPPGTRPRGSRSCVLHR